MPVRKITNGGRKVIGKFPSLKMKRAVWWESQLERDYIYYLEIDPEVISFIEQPLKIRYVLDGEIHHYTPDFLVERPGRKQIIEVKDEKSANKDEYRLLFRLVTPICEKEGYEFMVVTDGMIRRKPLIDNIKLLHKYSRTDISYKHQAEVYEFFSKRKEDALRELISFFASKKLTIQSVYALIYRGMLSIDLTSAINPKSRVSLAVSPALFFGGN